MATDDIVTDEEDWLRRGKPMLHSCGANHYHATLEGAKGCPERTMDKAWIDRAAEIQVVLKAPPVQPLQSGPVSIRCPKCGMISHNINDVIHRYCGNCHEFHEDGI